ncbi:putative RNA-binding protein rbm25 [Rosellinia necatrix]|uniref:Putative RNA-binding protein rbm25 n=1 Tax=Rosellinia necatrix TaxID=77044 RepID=A0A1S7UIH4_ROSNE|nr:putative RNA-binding protein rbm25 [Rosellinia necatrix]
MAYNPYGGVPGFGPPPTYNSYPGANGPPGMPSAPGLGPPPGMSAPGMAPPPGVQQPSITQANRPSGMPPNFQAPPNMPNINFSAPVIRLGALSGRPSASGAPGRKDSETPTSAGPRAGVGMDRGLDQARQAMRDNLQSLVQPTRDEVVRTIFVNGITPGVGGNQGIEQILNAAGKLRRWDRPVDSSGKELEFGFVQFEDTESLWIASEIFRDVEIPTTKQTPSDTAAADDATYEKFDKSQLQFRFDEKSTKLLEDYKEGRVDEAGSEARLEAARGALKQTIKNMFYPPARSSADADGDVTMGEASAQNGENVEVVNIPLAQEDELADIPAEMRETVAAEIAAFRERSVQRDMERLKKEEELEALERQRNGAARHSRLSSPPPSNTNNIPLGPRRVPNAPSGPKGLKSDMGKDYNRSVNFVNGGVANGAMTYNRDEEDDDSASDEELERRRVAKQKSEAEKAYLDAERRWLNREKSRTAALEREKGRDVTDEENAAAKREEALRWLQNFDDDVEAARKKEEYYKDRSAWMRDRAAKRGRENAADEADRLAEEQERAKEEAEREQARGMADSFLERQAQEMEQRHPARIGLSAPQPFKLSLGAAAQKAQAQRAAPQRKTIAEVEGLLEDEDEDPTTRRQLIPIKFEPTMAAAMSDEERDQAVRALAQEIPNEKDGLWGWDVKWDYLDEGVIREKLRPFVEKKLVEYLGVQEQLLIEVVEEHLRKHGKPEELVVELAEALDDEAEALVKKLWRMVIFFTESEKRGLSA